MVSQIETPVYDSKHAPNLSVEGLVQVFMSHHRSFFTSVMAQAMRIASQGTPVLIVQFLKGGIRQGPDRPIQLSQHLDWLRCNIPRCIDTPQLDDDELRSLLDLWHHTQDMVCQGRYDLVVLDELSLAIHFGFIPEAEVLEFLKQRPSHVDVILTGTDITSAILEVADQITELRRSHQP
ncbi:P-loop NTPase family protein [Myxacorys almedinensis]|uniref:P-loop NTPase family protein n=1 Tax=Myxacorys almedinensis A TaxID=2690445 RepID=A0A8J7Z0A7_9CYAN|nr:P-loop NTPase family protein [Myxacorys almedinensis]NDJ15811.1 P-loop NTPase family protein [Myxacorys almedinensis A]